MATQAKVLRLQAMESYPLSLKGLAFKQSSTKACRQNWSLLFHKYRFVKKKNIPQTSFPFKSRVSNNTKIKYQLLSFSMVI